MQLSKSEEQLMEVIWQQGTVFMKDLIDASPDPKPASTTVATLLKRMQEKGFVGYTVFGNSRQYYALVSKEDYFSKHVRGIIKNFFGNSVAQFASFFTSASDLSKEELEDLKRVIDEQLKHKEP
ncbi:BlaI/MecI/CopY family transcriptional regulator [Runella slithyformis]|uniref:Transcriptional repressor, CopY family n=1 Tax=Runella slithyformis (strain ATCC 29530 / DSM 19594 / LMG 11500 / NCIMB 11436 / LSU 4) TaxID=761193 RepID=A0A7U4E6W5_RUNSL|nr:BlaI/MecI/CopY family transcriptional regulator [Runella slithyformis]AEI50036.1 transcriptional repressor, CopY family [Runella slithyformis DSM 19594]